MPRRAAGLSALKVQKAGPGRYGDGAGLYLLVRAPKERYWIFRYVRSGRMREMGLGPAIGRTAVSLADARKKARRLYDMIREEGLDPLDERDAARDARRVERGKATTFKACADGYIEAHRAGWRNAKHSAQWQATLDTYVAPVFGDLPVQAVDVGLVLKVLEPIWTKKPETASRVRGRIESILDWAKARGYRDGGENPARWRGHLAQLLPARTKVRRVKHHPALPYADLGEFMAALRGQEGIAARALEFTILTAARTGETIGARWCEVDLAEKVWIVPAERIKAGKEHRVPLSARALEIIEAMRGGDDIFIFPGGKAGRALSNMAMLALLRRMGRDDLTAHGFRSTFRDWAAERTSYPSEVAEMALAHAVGDRVEAAYRRGDLFEKRRRLAEEWSRFCSTPTQKPARGKIATLRGRA